MLFYYYGYLIRGARVLIQITVILLCCLIVRGPAETLAGAKTHYKKNKKKFM
jgi:hypothetical protein